MYPFKFNPILKSTIWGGEKIIPFKHLNIEQPQVGEVGKFLMSQAMSLLLLMELKPAKI